MRFLQYLIYLMSLVLFSAMVAGYFGWIHPALDSFSAFRLHLAWLTILSGLILAGIGGRLGGISIAVAAVVALYTTTASGVNEAETTSAKVAPYRLLQTNVRFDNATPKELLRLIGEVKPDVITAQEVTQNWRDEFATIKGAYPFQLYCDAYRKIGQVAILSRRPFAQDAANYCGDGAAIAIQTIMMGGQNIKFASVHLHWPWPHEQHSQIAEMRPVLERLAGGNVLLAGDLNATRWSQTAKQISHYSKSQVHPFKGGTWLAYEFPAAWTEWFGLAIDNVFSSGVGVRSIRTQRYVGSDHLPMLIEFTLPVQGAPERPEPAAS